MNEFEKKKSSIIYFLRYYMNMKNVSIEEITDPFSGIKYIDVILDCFKLRYPKEQFDSDSEKGNARYIMHAYINHLTILCFLEGE